MVNQDFQVVKVVKDVNHSVENNINKKNIKKILNIEVRIRIEWNIRENKRFKK